MKIVLGALFLISVYASSSFAAVEMPQEERTTAGEHFDVERFSASAFRCFDHNEKLFKERTHKEPSIEQREAWVELCANTPDGSAQ